MKGNMPDCRGGENADNTEYRGQLNQKSFQIDRGERKDFLGQART